MNKYLKLQAPQWALYYIGGSVPGSKRRTTVVRLVDRTADLSVWRGYKLSYYGTEFQRSTKNPVRLDGSDFAVNFQGKPTKEQVACARRGLVAEPKLERPAIPLTELDELFQL